ncbi:MAG: ABC transporter permease [Nitrospinota bacterium]
MHTYIIRRILYAIPILIGINIITFILFFVINTPDQMARLHLGMKRVTPEAIEKWKEDHNYHLPIFWNGSESGIKKITQAIFYQKSAGLFIFRFGKSDEGRDIAHEITQRMWPSLAIAIPTFIIGLMVNITVSLFIAFVRGSYLDVVTMIWCVIIMSISGLFYIIGGQFLFGKILHLVPISGYDSGISVFKFVVLPVLIGVISGIGSGVRWYRTIFLEEIGKDYIRTARAKGLTETSVLFKHALKNALIPILTGVVVVIPQLFMGSLVMEAFFGIPGLGSYTIDAIRSQDFGIVRAMVFLGAMLYIIGLILTDICYSRVDPRIRFE